MVNIIFLKAFFLLQILMKNSKMNLLNIYTIRYVNKSKYNLLKSIFFNSRL